MPNYCFNSLDVSGKEEDVKKFVKKAKGKESDLKLDHFVKMPKELDYPKNYMTRNNDVHKEFEKQKKLNLKKYGFEYWYDWRIANWGTKWDVDADVSERNTDKNGNAYVSFNFDSAWNPPIVWLEKVAKKYKNLRFNLYYEESGMGFEGNCICENGICENEERDYTHKYCDGCDEDFDEEDLSETDEGWFCEECIREMKGK